MAESAALLVDEVSTEQPVRQWVLSVPYPLRFLFASRPEITGAVLGIVYRVIATHLARQAGFSAKRARTGAVTLIQRFGSALNLNLHFHMLFVDGVYVERPDGALSFRWVKAPTGAELTGLASRIASRVGRFLERQGLLEGDRENPCLSDLALKDEPMDPLLAHSITCRIAVGPCAGRKVFTPQSLPAGDEPCSAVAGRAAGFSLHAGVAARADVRGKIERLCRYISRPAVSEARRSLTPGGQVRYQLKTPYSEGTTHVLSEPLDFIARLAALVPKPRVNLTRFHGVFAPNSAQRAQVTKAGRGRGARCPEDSGPAAPSAAGPVHATVPPDVQQVMIEDAPTFLDEANDREQLAFELEWITDFSKPTLLTLGDQSPPTFAPVVSRLSRALPHAEILTLPGAGHIPHATHPNAYVEAVIEFMRRHAA